jgi:hypothetical protein
MSKIKLGENLKLGGKISFVEAIRANLLNFSVTTTSGTILVNWGDGTSDTIDSGVPINHGFISEPIPNEGFWSGIRF